MTSLDIYLKHAGLFGPAQYLMIATGLLLQIYVGWPAVVAVFTAIDVPYRCMDPKVRNLSLKTEHNFDSKCREGCSLYQYDTSVSSMVSEFDLACGTGPTLVSSANSAFWVGFLASCFIAGPIADRFGRRFTSLAACGCYIIIALLLPFSRSVYEFIALRFMAGVFHYPLTFIVYILVAEWIPTEKFAIVGLTSVTIFELGEIICALVGYYFSYSWRRQLIVLALPLFFVFLAIYATLPESARWLFQMGKFSDCEKVLRKVASRNGNKMPVFNWVDFSYNDLVDESCNFSSNKMSESRNESESLLRTVPPVKPRRKANANWLTLFGTPRGAFLVLTNFIIWFSSSLVFYGLIYNVSTLSGDIYLNTCLLALTGIPAWFACFAMDYFGRKKTLLFCLLTSSMACILIPVTNRHYFEATVYVALAGKCFSTAGFDLIYVYSTEIVPTEVRSSALSVCSACARLGTITAPFVIQMGVFSEIVPYAIFSASGLLSFLFGALFMFETLGRPMTDSVEQYLTLARRQTE